ncbi:unnamed protein product [Nippostrongylus brasiliensis]|uniref:Nucleoprotein n=1 Tax=Nippostrongylus brasiliensis TaxID=27835 RepID=A0A0N4YA78_NIPBR|nr:unnamed protein product [Nippostrongylus brasiliensis]
MLLLVADDLASLSTQFRTLSSNGQLPLTDRAQKARFMQICIAGRGGMPGVDMSTQTTIAQKTDVGQLMGTKYHIKSTQARLLSQDSQTETDQIPTREHKDTQKWEVLQKIPIHRIFLETDVPHFRPAQYHQLEGRRKTDWISFPTMAVNVAFIIARAKSMDVNDVIRATTANTQQTNRIEEITKSTQIPPGDQVSTSTFRAGVSAQAGFRRSS